MVFTLNKHPPKGNSNVKFWKGCLALLLIFINAYTSFAALPDFTLTVTKTDETCSGNGTLTFTAQNTQPSAVIEFRVFKLPDVTNPIAVLNTNFLDGLTSGDYRVLATQTLAGETNSQTQDITIDSSIVSLAYTISHIDATCGNNGSMTVSVFSGIGALYEIISGPVTVPPQPSPTFTSLPAGVYEVRVFDNCGEGWVATHTILAVAGQIDIAPATFNSPELPTCDSVSVTNTLSSLSSAISYPITLVYTVHPPDGSADVIINTTIATGDISSQDVVTVMPFYNDQIYTYDLVITDACGNVFFENDILINLKFISALHAQNAKCGQHFLNIASANYVAPLTVTFLSFPAGFDPVAFNPQHPGPFSSDSIDYGNFNMSVPLGFYSVQITDACGHTATSEITVEYIPATPTVSPQPHPGCQSNISDVTIIVSGFTIVSAVITNVPATYPHPLPYDVSMFLVPADGSVVIPNMPTGNYTIVLTDECNNIYTTDFFVPDTATSVTFSARTGCELGKGAIRIRGSSTNLVSAIITSAPATYPQTLPYNVTFNITPGGIFSMNDFPAGIYTIDVIDNCGLPHTVTVTVLGYEITQNDYNITPHCGSFDLELTHVSNNSTGAAFFLQKLDPDTGLWGHPETNVPYVDGTVPTPTNSYVIGNIIINYNISYLGDFRIIKVFESYENGSLGEYKNCIEIIREFTFNNALAIIDVEKTTCNGQYSDVSVTAEGIAPLIYKITSKNGVAFLIDNGTNNVFASLEPAVYNFSVSDACGNVVNRLVDVALLPSLATATPANDLEACDESDMDGMATFHLTSQDPVILGGQPAANFVITYHLTLVDANAGSSPLPDDYVSENTTIYARLRYALSTNCYDVVFFNLIVHPYPLPQMQTAYHICPNENVTITAESGFDSYLWSTGETTQSITVAQPGQYTLEVTQGTCTGSSVIEVLPSEIPQIDHIETTDWTANDNTITVFLTGSGTGNFIYSLDNVNFQTSNVFDHLLPGAYTVHVKDINGCGGDSEEVYLLSYPHYFTPNGDGIHDYWNIYFVELEPHLKTYIFDRYGKFIKEILPNDPGWDGTLNGRQLPSTDYWFKVIRENGEEKRGHFAMKR